jgi:hypothetical protein
MLQQFIELLVSIVYGIIQSFLFFSEAANPRVKATVQFIDERLSSEEVVKTLNDKSLHRAPSVTRALIPACVSLQISMKMGMKLAEKAVTRLWGIEQELCNFEVGCFLVIGSY